MATIDRYRLNAFEIHNKGLLVLDEGKIERFYLDVGKIIGDFHFSVIPMGTLGKSFGGIGS